MTNGLKKIKIKLTEAPVRSEAEGGDIDLEHGDARRNHGPSFKSQCFIPVHGDACNLS